MNKAAFFDIDGTLFRNSLLIEHFSLLTKNKIINDKIWYDDIKPLYQSYQDRIGAYEKYLDKATKLYQLNLIGINREIINKYASIVIEENKNKIYRITKKAVEDHIKNGYFVFFISGSPDYLVREFANLYSATASISTKYIFDNENRFTGEIMPMWDSKNKLKAIKNLQKKYEIDLDSSHAYGDTNGDFSMFLSVGHPHAINPSYELINRLNSDSRVRIKTKVHIERKDVNYCFELKNMKISFKMF